MQLSNAQAAIGDVQLTELSDQVLHYFEWFV
jgi:hypothetical protein